MGRADGRGRRWLTPRVGGLVALAFLIAVGLRARAINHTVDAYAQVPGMSHHVRVQDLPQPKATPAVRNDARRIPRPGGRVAARARGLSA